ncbi:UNKNOWN [Stylonychia lemnae]|uniref:DNA2/NAM7 helicase-like C-terminal domain-containing protein n=1 Tax=Stylonychia lemnae TaxID=5949 RepID=A0A078AK32_STYLE|nr:UNKNOWN [Stylonychia lemnae]|eukprot:CDW81163.1 UNKNOWN [Stylonychia lemnae]
MKSNSDQLDKFHEDICKWDIHTDILNHKDAFIIKSAYYSSDDYIATQRNQLYNDLKTTLQKNLQRQLGAIMSPDKHVFQLKHCEMVKKFVVFELNQVTQQKKAGISVFNQNDVVVIFRQDIHQLEKHNLIGVVDSSVEGLVLLKSIIKMEEPDERSFNMGKSLTQDSFWIIEKIGSVINYNKSYLALQTYQDIDMQENLNDPINDIIHSNNFYSLSKQQERLLYDQFNYTLPQMQAITQSLKKKGVSIIDGEYLSGKTTIAVGLIQALNIILEQVRIERELEKQQKQVKTYSIQELLDNESSEDEYYSDKSKSQVSFPWFQKGYKHIYDELDYTNQQSVAMKEQYPTSDFTDKKILLKAKEKDQTKPPERIVLLSPNSLTVDKHLSIIQQLGLDKTMNIIRIGHSNHDESLNKKFSIEYLSGANMKKTQKDEALDQVKEDLLRQSQVVLMAIHSLNQQMIERTITKQDTVIVDDASIINEMDILQALKRGAIRLILIGNHKLQSNMFQLNAKSGDRTLYQRIFQGMQNLNLQNTIQTLPKFEKQVQLVQAVKTQPKAKKGKKAEETVRVQQGKEIEIEFIDLTNGEEKDQKESYINEDEAQSIADYLVMAYKSLDLNDLAITTPFRTQMHMIRSVFQSREDFPEELKAFAQFGSFDEYVSQTYKTLIISVCKTKNIAKNGGPLLNSQLNVDFLKTRAVEKIIVFGRAKSLNALWRNEFFEIAKSQEKVTEL